MQCTKPETYALPNDVAKEKKDKNKTAVSCTKKAACQHLPQGNTYQTPNIGFFFWLIVQPGKVLQTVQTVG